MASSSMSEINAIMDQIKSNKAVKCAITVNHNGDTINTESNDSNIDELSLKALARTGYQYITSVRSATSQYDINENVQVLRVRLKEDEITIVPEGKYYLIVVSHPKKV